jgi:predicted alpha/beta-fold hydrolase
METYGDDLRKFETDGAVALPVANDQGYASHDGARLWYTTYGSGAPVIMLHGGLGHSGNWGYQVRALTNSGYRAVLIDSRGHGRSTRDSRPFITPGPVLRSLVAFTNCSPKGARASSTKFLVCERTINFSGIEKRGAVFDAAESRKKT